MPSTLNLSKVASFSIPPTQPDNIKQVEKLQKYCKEHGTSFSHLVVQGIKHINDQLGLNDDNKTA